MPRFASSIDVAIGYVSQSSASRTCKREYFRPHAQKVLAEAEREPALEPTFAWLAAAQAAWTNLIKHRPAAKLTIDLKFRAVVSQRSATRLKRLRRPTPCSMRALAL